MKDLLKSSCWSPLGIQRLSQVIPKLIGQCQVLLYFWRLYLGKRLIKRLNLFTGINAGRKCFRNYISLEMYLQRDLCPQACQESVYQTHPLTFHLSTKPNPTKISQPFFIVRAESGASPRVVKAPHLCQLSTQHPPNLQQRCDVIFKRE